MQFPLSSSGNINLVIPRNTRASARKRKPFGLPTSSSRARWSMRSRHCAPLLKIKKTSVQGLNSKIVNQKYLLKIIIKILKEKNVATGNRTRAAWPWLNSLPNCATEAAVGRWSFLSPVGILCHHLLCASAAATCIQEPLLYTSLWKAYAMCFTIKYSFCIFCQKKVVFLGRN